MNQGQYEFDPDDIHGCYPIEKLKPNPKNRNQHSDDQIERLCKLIQYQGFRQPIVVSNRSGLIVAGHGRYLAALKLGMITVPVSFQDFESEEQEYAFGISDNSIASWAELDLSAINTDIGDLGPEFDIDLLGIKDFTVDVAEKLEPGCDEDEIPDGAEPRTKRGDLYILGNHRLLCGDATNIDDVEKLMGGEKADMVFTDPPYGQLKIFNKEGQVGKDNVAKAKKYGAYANEGTFRIEPLLELISGRYEKLVIWGGNYFADVLPITTSWLCWDKRAGEHSWFSDFELAWTNLGIPARLYKHVWQGMIREKESEERVHPTQKPIALAEWVLNEWTKPENLIFDFFGGSGWSLIACEKTNRRCFMMEIDPHYCDIIVARWEKYSGKKAELVSQIQSGPVSPDPLLSNQLSMA